MQSKGTSIFSQMLQLFNRNDFSSAVRQFHGDKGVKGFRFWDQFVVPTSRDYSATLPRHNHFVKLAAA